MDPDKQPEKQPAQPSSPPPAPAPQGMRASDADRDRTADILRDALAEGRIDAEEHSERIDAVYRAKTVAELRPLVQDLPAVRTGPRPHAAGATLEESADGGPSEKLIAVLSSSTRKGRWRIGRRTHAVAVFGSVEIDLTQAVFTQRLTVIEATAVFGNVEVRVPENVTLRGSGSGLLGNFEVASLEAGDPEAPVVVVNGFSVLGNIEARAKRGRRVADLHARMRKHLGG
ncbi:DUF1707 SHOCT-like domain-containing protein [Streptomyces solincola]|nr:DUF1707 domain-containing protein [Streptomyces solincola]